jgi:hypothetical protein
MLAIMRKYNCNQGRAYLPIMKSSQKIRTEETVRKVGTLDENRNRRNLRTVEKKRQIEIENDKEIRDSRNLSRIGIKWQ